MKIYHNFINVTWAVLVVVVTLLSISMIFIVTYSYNILKWAIGLPLKVTVKYPNGTSEHRSYRWFKRIK